MATAMESEVSRSLSALRDCWYLKIPDVPRFGGSTMRADIPRPFDYIAVCSRSMVVGIECKETKSHTSLPLGNISPHQVEALCRFESLGAHSYLLVNMRATKHKPRINLMFALSAEQCATWYYMRTDRKSISIEWMNENAIAIPRIKLPLDNAYGWDLRKIAPFNTLDYRRPHDMCIPL